MDAVAGPRGHRRVPASWRIGLGATAVRADAGTLHPAEATLVAGSGPDRVAQLATGRQCARIALRELGIDLADRPILADEHGAPVWPDAVVGSISHTTGWTGAVAARRGRHGGIASLGLDAEVAAPLPEGVLEVVASEAERTALARLSRTDADVPWDAVLFAAKEAAYKAWYPLTGVVLHHEQVAVVLTRDGRFRAEARDGIRMPCRVRGRWHAGPDVVVTLAVIAPIWWRRA
jgi:4'-phosphopantetheinyl transferase EntD